MSLTLGLILLAAAALGLAENASLGGWRRLLGMAAAVAAPALLYFVLFPPAHEAPGHTLQVLTPGAATPPLPDAADLRTVALPGSVAPAGVERVPDLATALRRHGDATALRIVGDGLVAADRDAARGRALQFDAPPLPRGVIALEVPADIRAGHPFAIGGQVGQAQGLQLVLREPGGARQGPLALAADGRFRFTLFATRAAELSYELQLLAADGSELQRLAVPVQVRDGAALRLLLLSGGPDADLKYLQRWALDAGHTVDARISLSRGIAQQRGDASLSAATLAATDVAVVDDRAWNALDKAARTRLLAAADAGMGLLLRLVAVPDTALTAEWRGIGVGLDNADIATTLHLGGEIRQGATAAVQRLPLAAKGDALIPIARDGGGDAFAVARNRGQGRIGAWWLQGSHTLVTSGQAALHDALWADALDALARPRQPVLPAPPELSWQFERTVLCAREASLRVTAPSGAVTDVATRGAGDARWCGGYWPRETGWHTLQAGEAGSRFFVRAAADAPTLHQARTSAATRALAGAGGADASWVDASARVQPPGARWPWFLAWLLPTSVLWWLQRARRPRMD